VSRLTYRYTAVFAIFGISYSTKTDEMYDYIFIRFISRSNQ